MAWRQTIIDHFSSKKTLKVLIFNIFGVFLLKKLPKLLQSENPKKAPPL